MNEQKLKELFSNEEFLNEVFALETAEEVQGKLQEQGVEVTVEDITKIRDIVANHDFSQGYELTEDELEMISGGVVVTTVCAVVGCVFGVIGGTASAANFVHNATKGKW